MSKDIVERLREAAALPTGLYAEAADTIEELRAERDALREKLESHAPDGHNIDNETHVRACAERDAAREALSKAADDLAEAAVDIDSWGAYASDYFQKKHDLQGCVADYAKRSEQARAALAAAPLNNTKP